jgi:hypothetical protein
MKDGDINPFIFTTNACLHSLSEKKHQILETHWCISCTNLIPRTTHSGTRRGWNISDANYNDNSNK